MNKITVKPTKRIPPIITELWGQSRYETAVEVSKSGWKTADNIVLATGENFPDTLCAVPLAKQLNAPVLLTEKKSLTEATSIEISRLGAKKVYIIGGTGVISDKVISTLKTKGLQCERLCGKDRYLTDLEVASYMKQHFNMSNEIAVATGEDFADALSISSIAAKKNMIIFLTPKNNLPECITEFINDNGFTKTYVVGENDVINDSVTSQLPNVQRIKGADKYERNVNVLNTFSGDIDLSTLYIATGENYPDALAGSAIASLKDTPVLLINSDDISPATSNYLISSESINIIILGGWDAVGYNLEKIINGFAYGTIKMDSVKWAEPLICVNVKQNSNYTFPVTVKAKLYNGETKEVPVEWCIDKYGYNEKTGEYDTITKLPDNYKVDTSKKFKYYQYYGHIDGWISHVDLYINVEFCPEWQQILDTVPYTIAYGNSLYYLGPKGKDYRNEIFAIYDANDPAWKVVFDVPIYTNSNQDCSNLTDENCSALEKALKAYFGKDAPKLLKYLKDLSVKAADPKIDDDDLESFEIYNGKKVHILVYSGGKGGWNGDLYFTFTK